MTCILIIASNLKVLATKIDLTGYCQVKTCGQTLLYLLKHLKLTVTNEAAEVCHYNGFLNTRLRRLYTKTKRSISSKNVATTYKNSKTSSDTEATIIGYEAGKGKFTGLIGKFLMIDDDGIEFGCPIGKGYNY